MNEKYLIYQIIQFAESNIVRAYEELLKLLTGGSMLSDGELDKIDECLKNIGKIMSALRENLKKCRELDEARQNVVKMAKKVGEEI